MKKIFCPILACALLILLTFSACRKPNKPEIPVDPCANKVLVTALLEENYVRAHFEIEGKYGLNTWLNAVNWSDYASKIIPGKKYRIAYKEVDCPQEWCGTGGFDCGIPELKCIKIICLEDAGYTDCLGADINPLKFDDEYSLALKGLNINGNSLKIHVGYSGCDRAAIKNFRLALRSTMMRCPGNEQRVFLAKVVTPDYLICQAYFEEDACFDLSALRTYMISENYDMSKPVIIRLQNRDGSDMDFTYKP